MVVFVDEAGVVCLVCDNNELINDVLLMSCDGGDVNCCCCCNCC